MKEITITKWEAFDGAVFDDDSKCIEYEDECFERLANESKIIFLNHDREEIAPREIEHCDYLYVPDGKSYNLISQIFDLYELYLPFSASQNAYGEEFEEDNPDICGWWMYDIDREIWRNLRIEARTIEQISADLEKRTGVA